MRRLTRQSGGFGLVAARKTLQHPPATIRRAAASLHLMQVEHGLQPQGAPRSWIHPTDGDRQLIRANESAQNPQMLARPRCTTLSLPRAGRRLPKSHLEPADSTRAILRHRHRHGLSSVPMLTSRKSGGLLDVSSTLPPIWRQPDLSRLRARSVPRSSTSPRQPRDCKADRGFHPERDQLKLLPTAIPPRDAAGCRSLRKSPVRFLPKAAAARGNGRFVRLFAQASPREAAQRRQTVQEAATQETPRATDRRIRNWGCPLQIVPRERAMRPVV